MRHEKDHEKRVVLEDIPSDDTMISSLVLSKYSYHPIHQDEDTSTVHGFEDEKQLYQALKMRNEHGQFAMNIGATSILIKYAWMMMIHKIPVLMMTPQWMIQWIIQKITLT